MARAAGLPLGHVATGLAAKVAAGVMVDRLTWLRAVLADHDLPARALHVAFVIAEHVNKRSGIAWPSQATIAARLGFHADGRGVRPVVGALQDRGFLDVKKPGRGGSIRYRLTIPPKAGSDAGQAVEVAPPTAAGQDEQAGQDRHKQAGQDRHKQAGLDPNTPKTASMGGQDRHKRTPQTGTFVPVIDNNEPIRVSASSANPAREAPEMSEGLGEGPSATVRTAQAGDGGGSEGSGVAEEQRAAVSPSPAAVRGRPSAAAWRALGDRIGATPAAAASSDLGSVAAQSAAPDADGGAQ